MDLAAHRGDHVVLAERHGEQREGEGRELGPELAARRSDVADDRGRAALGSFFASPNSDSTGATSRFIWIPAQTGWAKRSGQGATGGKRGDLDAAIARQRIVGALGEIIVERAEIDDGRDLRAPARGAAGGERAGELARMLLDERHRDRAAHRRAET